ncbi:MAG TPA: type IV pilus modification PilV family protein [Candidatus Brocadiia bacterium]|nr:type II secretion system protein [Candidatus Brocadiales bacterium]
MLNIVVYLKKNVQDKCGFTLIEVIIFLVLAGIILPLIFIPFMTGLKSYSTPEVVSTATFLGEELMEEIKSKGFDENPASPTDPANLGPEGESRSQYDDVDDYDGLTETSSGFGNYSRSVTVFYVSADNLDADAGAITNFKRIQVTVTNSQIPNVAMATLVSN